MRQKELDDIMKGLSLLQYYIKFSSNKLDIHTTNKQCESFFAGLFNLMYGYNLKTLKKNYPAIDLKDKVNKFAVQITSNGLKDKLKYTVNKFEKKAFYKDFDTLLHFIIGEKCFTPPIKNPYTFKRGEFDVFVADAVVNSDKYQIVVQDLYGLILEIDALDDEKLSEVRKYINKNINQVIEAVRQPLYDHVPETVHPYKATAYFYHFKFDKKEQQDVKVQLDKLADVLADLEDNTRRYLYFATTCLRSHSSGLGLIVSEPTLRKKLNLTKEQVREEIEILERSGFISIDTINDDMAFVLNYYDEDGNEMLQDLIKFCQKQDRSLEDLIIDLDFSQLD
ncbi:SMEK domain-containing protein [Paenibacillus endophyticus]|nr:SMEK domain-containing protein [Paenibacillus endophyticus]